MARAKTTSHPIVTKDSDRLERQSMPTKHATKMQLWINKRSHRIGENPNLRNLLITTDNANPMGTFLRPAHTKVDPWVEMERFSLMNRDGNLPRLEVTQIMRTMQDHQCKSPQAGVQMVTIIVAIIQMGLVEILHQGSRDPTLLLLTRISPTTMGTTMNEDTMNTDLEGLQPDTTVQDQPDIEVNTPHPPKTHHILLSRMVRILRKEGTHHGDHHHHHHHHLLGNILHPTGDNTEVLAHHRSIINDPRPMGLKDAIHPSIPREVAPLAERFHRHLIEV
jgi:hypothetical protein